MKKKLLMKIFKKGRNDTFLNFIVFNLKIILFASLHLIFNNSPVKQMSLSDFMERLNASSQFAGPVIGEV